MVELRGDGTGGGVKMTYESDKRCVLQLTEQQASCNLCRGDVCVVLDK
jgi:hypothetical protein